MISILTAVALCMAPAEAFVMVLGCATVAALFVPKRARVDPWERVNHVRQ